MTVLEYRLNENLVKKAKAILENPDVQQMIEALEGSTLNRAEAPPLPTDGDKLLHLGKILGYNLALANLRNLAVKHNVPKQPKQEFKPPKE